ncbi:MAG: class I SAM-dependent methyltransferase, partial [Myxococcales bacterium]|nr:class I SAM-dependent methyltransferase [Myxococcales bacterium]
MTNEKKHNRISKISGVKMLILLMFMLAPVWATAQDAGANHHHGGHHGKKPLVHTFEDTEKYAAKFERAERDDYQKPDEVIKALAIQPGQIIADVGAGSGYFTRRLAQAVGPAGAVYAIDIEPGMLALVRKDAETRQLSNVIPILASVDSPKLPPGKVDMIFISDTVHHIPNRVGYFAELKAHLSPDSRVVISDFKKMESPVGPPLAHKLSEEEIEAELTKAG